MYGKDNWVQHTWGLGLAGCALAHPLVPPQEKQPQQGQHQLPARAGDVIPIDLGHRRGGSVHHPHLGRERRGLLTIGRDLGNRVRGIAHALADPQIAERHTSGFDGAHAQAVVGHYVDVSEHPVVAAVERAPRGIGVVGVGLDGQRVDGGGRAQVPSHGGRAGVEQDSRGGVPHRTLGRHGFVSQKRQIAADVQPAGGFLSGQQIACRTGRKRRVVFRTGLGRGKNTGQQRQQGAEGA